MIWKLALAASWKLWEESWKRWIWSSSGHWMTDAEWSFERRPTHCRVVILVLRRAIDFLGCCVLRLSEQDLNASRDLRVASPDCTITWIAVSDAIIILLSIYCGDCLSKLCAFVVLMTLVLDVNDSSDTVMFRRHTVPCNCNKRQWWRRYRAWSLPPNHPRNCFW